MHRRGVGSGGAIATAALGLAFAGLVAGLPASAARAQDDGAPTTPRIYRWIDENGIAHYTTDLGRVPSGLRSRAGALSSEPSASTSAGSSDLWASRDRSVVPSEDTWFEGGATPEPELDPASRAALDEEQAVAAFDLDLRISELESVIRADEESLKTMISNPDSGGPLASADNAEFRSIAMRLPERLRELTALRDQRSALSGGEPE